MPLDADMQRVLDTLAATSAVDLTSLPPLAAAQRLRTSRAIPPPQPDAAIGIADVMIPGPHGEIPLRIYRPAETPPTGLLVNFHGGGWVMGSVESDDARCRSLLRASGAAIVSADYRLAPEHRFPAPLDDCRAALAWAWERREEIAGPGAKLAVGGSSAGANLATAAAMAEREAIPLVLQLLISPVCDDDFDTPSYLENGEGLHLTRKMMRWFWDQYAPRAEDRASSLAAPLKSPDLSGVASAHLILAEYDPLRDEGLAYAERLRQAAVPVQVSLYPGALHAFPSLAPASAIAQRAFEEIGASLRRAFGA
ncbi:MAG: putative lipase [Phenylobacterium sp.]|nr:putative lipase [Phenylobacterium sp.]